MNILNVIRYRWWGLLPLAVLVWHGSYTITSLSPDYLLFVCYTSNLLLGLGILGRSGLMVGTGFGWIMIALPLWLYDSVIHSDWEPSCIAFHVCGFLTGAIAVIRFRLPGFTWVFAISMALALQVLARLFTDPSLNINAAFRVYDGWQEVFPDYRIYFVSMMVGFSLFFILLTKVNNRYFSRGERT